MHNLEHLLLLASKRAHKMKKYQFARDLEYLTSESHNYEPVEMMEGGNADERLAEMNQKWSRRYGHLMFNRK